MPNKYKPLNTDLSSFYGFDNMPDVEEDEVVELVPDDDDPNFVKPDYEPGQLLMATDYTGKQQVVTFVRAELSSRDDQPILQMYRDETFFGIMPPMWRAWSKSKDGRTYGYAAGHVRRLTPEEQAAYIDFDALLAEPGPDGRATCKEWFKDALQALLGEGEGFSGKRPLGDSGWDWALDEAAEKHAPGVPPQQVWDRALDYMFAK
jgi:hypothetical protein